MKKLVPLLLVVASLASCQLFKPVVFNPHKDPQMIAAVKILARITDSAYKSPDLSFAELSPRYDIINHSLDSMQTVDIMRLKPNNILTLVSNTKKVLRVAMDQHRHVNTLNPFQANIFNGQMQAQFKALLLAENSLK